MNIYLDQSNPYFNQYRIEEKKKLEDLILKHDQEKLTVTKTLETKLEEKNQNINKYEARLNELELNSGK